MKAIFLEAGVVGAIIAVVITGFAQSWNQTGAPARNWGHIAESADGRIIYAISSLQPPAVSRDGGQTWTNCPITAYIGVACSASGQTAFTTMLTNGTGGSGSDIYMTTNFGTNWTQTGILRADWRGMACSADATKSIFAMRGGLIYTSTNGLATWQAATAAPVNAWEQLVCSTDGNVLAACDENNRVYTSTNFGVTWTNHPVPATWLACSADGRTMASAGKYTQLTGFVYVSTNSGNSWNQTPVVGSSVACSADGTTLIAAGSQIYISTNSGQSWVTNTVAGASTFNGIVCSADGCKIVTSCTSPNGLWIGQVIPSPQLKLVPANGGLALSWTVPSTNFILQTVTNLTAQNWTAATNVPVLNPTNLNQQIGLPPPVGAGFYRLVTQ